MSDNRQQILVSSGILMNNQTFNIFAHIELVNLNLYRSRRVSVLVLDWGAGAAPSSQTNPIATLLNFTENIPPNTQQRLNAIVPAGHHYEIRVSYPDTDDVLVNAFGTASAGAGWLEGYTVLHRQFKRIC